MNRVHAGGTTRNARPLMRRNPHVQRQAELEGISAARLINSRSVRLMVKNVCSSKPLMSRGSSSMIRYVVCQPCIARLRLWGKGRYASEE
jgi:hypothetical protein